MSSALSDRPIPAAAAAPLHTSPDTSLAGPAAPPGGWLLEVRGVVKSFPGVLALDDVCFRLRAGSVHALMGENGAGKSTLMKIIAGVYRPDRGQILIKGRPVALTGPRDALAHGIAMIHQELNLMPHMT